MSSNLRIIRFLNKWINVCIKSRLHCRSPITATATSVISSCILWIAANPILRRVHLHAYTLTVTLESRFQRHQRPWPSMLFCHQGGVFLPNVWLSVLHLLLPSPCHLHRRNRAHTETTFWPAPSKH